MELKSRERPSLSDTEKSNDAEWEIYYSNHGEAAYRLVWLWNGKTWHTSCVPKQHLNEVTMETAWGQSWLPWNYMRNK